MSELPDGVVGIEASGKLAAEDYLDVVLPVVEKSCRRRRSEVRHRHA